MKKILICSLTLMLMLSFPVLSSQESFEREKIWKNEGVQTLIQPPIQWENTYGWPEPGWSYFVQQTSDGGYIATGVIYKTGGTNAEVYLVKTDANGNAIWSQSYGVASTFDCGYCVQQTTDGGYIIAGTYSGHALWLIKTDANGNQQWNNIFTSLGLDTAYSVQQTTDGGFIIVGGYHYSTGGPYDVWLIKTDSFGTQQWNNKIGTGGELGYCVRQTSDGGYIITGCTASGAGALDVLLLKTDAGGNPTWTQTFGGTSSEEGYSVRQTNDGGYIVTGYTYSFGAGQDDVYLIKTDAGGNPTWTQTFGGTSFDTGYSVRQTSDGGYLVGGTTQSFGAGGIDAYLVKTDASGNKQWDDTHGGPGHDDSRCADETTDGGYIIAGSKVTTFNEFWLIKLGNSTNQPPNKPLKPSGPTNGKAGTSYTYTSIVIDPDGDQIYYWFDWGDSTNSGWVGPYTSGTIGSASHIWTTQGNYNIKVKAKDDPHAAESIWSDPLSISMPKNKVVNITFLHFLQRHPNRFPIMQQLLGFL